MMTLLTRLDLRTRDTLAAALGLPDDADLAALVAEAERLRASERRASALSGQVRILEGDLERAHAQLDMRRRGLAADLSLAADATWTTIHQRAADARSWGEGQRAEVKRLRDEHYSFIHAVAELAGVSPMAHHSQALAALKLRLEST